MLVFIGRRALHSLFAVLGLVVLVFFLTRLTGNPANLYLPLDATQETRDAFQARYGFDQPLHIQFIAYAADLLRFDFGMSIREGRPAMAIALEAFPHTLQLAAIALTISISSALLIGALAAAKVGGMFDRVAGVASLAAASAPDFWVAIVAILVFSVGLGILPTSGTGSLLHWIMPLAVLCLRPFGTLVQVVRATMLNVLSAAYIKTAKAKGVPYRRIVFSHALRNSMLAVVTVAGDLATGLINGAVVVETIFGWPGIGKLMIDAIVQRDFAVVQATILITATTIFAVNIIIDLIYVALDPRIRHEAQS